VRNLVTAAEARQAAARARLAKLQARLASVAAFTPPDDPDALLLTGEVATWLQVSKRTVNHWTQRGSLPWYCRTLGGQYRYRTGDVADLLERILAGEQP
jgi:excisionase family DNA binding protein